MGRTVAAERARHRRMSHAEYALSAAIFLLSERISSTRARSAGVPLRPFLYLHISGFFFLMHASVHT